MSHLAPIMETEDWLKKHAGHDVVEETKRISIKLMTWKVCRTCKVRHLFKMETVKERDESDDVGNA